MPVPLFHSCFRRIEPIQSLAMIAKRVIPCLDVHDGKVTRGVQFGVAEKGGLRNVGDPVELALRYNEQGADEMVFFDITATAHGRGTMVDVIERAADQCFMPLTVGGGVRTIEDIRNLLLAGADKVAINTTAVDRPEFVREAAEKFGSQCIVAAIDAKSVGNGKYEIFTHGGRKATGIDAVAHAKKLVGYGAGEILLTSMDRDGVKSGYDLELTRAVSDAVGVPVIASGGVGNVQDLVDGVKKGHASAVLAASIFHFGQYSVAQAKEYLASRSIPVRT